MVLGIDASQANRKIRSGTEWYAFYLIREFKKILGGRGDIEIRLYLRDELQADLAENLPRNFKPKILHWPLKYLWGLKRLSWEMLVHPPDILFCPAHTIPLIHPQKTFTTLHDIGFEDNPELYDRLSLMYHQWSARLAVRKAFHIFTDSEFSKNRIRDVYHCPEEKLSVTYLGIDSKRSTERIESILKKYGLAERGYILFVGRLEPKKNILGMVKAHEMANPEKILVLAGRKVRIADVDDYLHARPELAKKIKFLGYIDEQDKPALYSGASIFLFPTLYEGFGLPILEAQAHGTPVITSNITSNPEVAGKGAIIVDPRNPKGIAWAIRELLSNGELRQTVIKSGVENLQRFSWEKTARKTLEKILEIVSPPHDPFGDTQGHLEPGRTGEGENKRGS
jgi:glycosyltransferase involved in cell wall biosynthesis